MILLNSRRLAGVALWGDSGSLRQAHAVVHQVLPEGLDGQFAMGLAYDLRKAFEGQRKREVALDLLDQPLTQYGVEIPWVVFIAQVAILRGTLALQPSTRRQQSVVYELEAMIEEAASEAFGDDAPEIMATIKRLSGCPELVEETVITRAIYYLRLASRKERRGALLPVLWTMLPTYGVHYEVMGEPAKRMIDPAVFGAIDPNDWPASIKW
jgi:hypothetical protein